MTFTVPVADPQTAEEVLELARRTRERRLAPPAVVKRKQVPALKLVQIPPPLPDFSEAAVIRRTAKRVAAALRALNYVPGSRKHAMLIVQRCAEEHGVTAEEILMPSRVERTWTLGARRAVIVRARHTAMARVYVACKMPVYRMGEFFRRDHTTILYALYKLGVKQPTKKGRATIPLNVVGNIVQAMLARGHERRPAISVAAKYGVNETSVRRIMQKYWKQQASRGRH